MNVKLQDRSSQHWTGLVCQSTFRTARDRATNPATSVAHTPPISTYMLLNLLFISERRLLTSSRTSDYGLLISDRSDATF